MKFLTLHYIASGTDGDLAMLEIIADYKFSLSLDYICKYEGRELALNIIRILMQKANASNKFYIK